MFVLGWYFVCVVFVLGLLVGLFFGLVLFVFCFIVFCGGFLVFYSSAQQCTESGETALRFCKNPKCHGY